MAPAGIDRRFAISLTRYNGTQSCSDVGMVRLMHKYVREKLRLIRYYSAPRRRTKLTKSVDAGLIAAVVFAFPATYLCDISVRQESIIIDRDGELSRLADDGVMAKILNPQIPVQARTDIPYGDFHLKLIEVRRGWPLKSTHEQARVILDLNEYDKPGTQRDVHLDADDPLHIAILQAMDSGRKSEISMSRGGEEEIAALRTGYAILIDRWREDSVGINRRLWAWVFNTAAWWVMLSAIFTFMAASLWVLMLIFLHNQQLLASQRQQAGLCANCGYNLFGLDFHGRCPECGTIIE